LVYTLVKFSSWDGITFKEGPRKFGMDDEALAKRLLVKATFPTVTEYFVPVGVEGKRVLVVLATHLEKEEYMKMAVSKVVGISKKKELTDVTACIMSLCHVIVVEVHTMDSGRYVTHTKPIDIFAKEGREALIATLSPPSPPPPSESTAATVLPTEIIEQIFKDLTLTGGVPTIPSFAAATAAFGSIAHDRILQLPGLTLTTFPAPLEQCIFGVHGNGDVGVYHFGDKRYTCLWNQMKSWTVMVDGADLGIGEVSLTPVDVDAATGKKKEAGFRDIYHGPSAAYYDEDEDDEDE